MNKIITFYDNVTQGPDYANIKLNSPSGAFTSVIKGNTLTITPTSDLPYNRWTQVQVPANAVLSTDGTPMVGTFIMAFTTSA